MEWSRTPVTLVTGDLPFGGHTITNLCRQVAAHDEELHVRVVPPTWLHDSGSGEDRSNPLASHDIVHLGNNPYSVPLLESLHSATEPPAVVLHDLWLFDLVTAWGSVRGTSNMALRLLTTNSGVRAGRTAQMFRSGEDVPPEEIAPLAGALLSGVLPPTTRILIHRDSSFVRATLGSAGLNQVTYAPLPLYYAEERPPSRVRPARWDVVVSGTGSFARRVSVVCHALRQVSTHRPIRVAVVGGMTREVAGCTLAEGSTLEMIPSADAHTWATVHSSARVGVRLGVGQLGEGSGLVRDYLAHGMNVVTDDTEPPVNCHPAVTFVQPSAGADEVASAMLTALDALEPAPVTDDAGGRAAYAAAHHDLLRESDDRTAAGPHAC